MPRQGKRVGSSICVGNKGLRMARLKSKARRIVQSDTECISLGTNQGAMPVVCAAHVVLRSAADWR